MTPGSLSAGPSGLGYLSVCGYVGDASLFYCPSSEAMPRLWYQSWAMGVESLRDLKSLGGADGATLTHGNWFETLYNKAAAWGGSTKDYVTNKTWSPIAYGHYAYRGMPLFNPSRGAPQNIVANLGTQRVFPGVRPIIDVDMGNTADPAGAWSRLLGRPPFKTVRALGGRALVSDVFGRCQSTTDATHNKGAGVYAHRSGYDVLYADGHVAWYGDPQESFIWRRTPDAAKYYSLGLAPSWYSDASSNHGFLGFHQFDEANGVDVGYWP